MLDVSFIWRAQFSCDHAEGKRLVPIDAAFDSTNGNNCHNVHRYTCLSKASAQTDKNRFLASYSFVQDMGAALGPLCGYTLISFSEQTASFG